VRQRHHARARGQQLRQTLQVQFATGSDRQVPQHQALTAGDLDPRHQVRMVLHLGDDDFIARLQRRPEAAGHQVQRRGGAACDHDALRRHAEEAADA
jgi:hypothetical protein